MRKLALALALMAALTATPTAAKDMSDAPMVRNQINWRAGRSELMPTLGWTINDRYFHNFIVSLGYRYHLTDWLGFGANVGWAFPIKTGFAENVESEKARPEEGLSFPVPASHLGLLADVHIELTHSGKFMFWGDAALPFDLHAIVGFGMVQVRWNSEAENRLAGEEDALGFKPSPKAGVGVRVFVDDGVAITLDIIDHMAFMYTAAEVSDDLRTYTFPTESAPLVHNVAAMLSFSIMMPYETTIEEE